MIRVRPRQRRLGRMRPTRLLESAAVSNPLLDLDALPAFGRIEASHARPALEKVLAENRARLAQLTAQANPTFASLVVPIEELSYNLSRVWSPIGHLNAVANSPQMRAAFNECLP